MPIDRDLIFPREVFIPYMFSDWTYDVVYSTYVPDPALVCVI